MVNKDFHWFYQLFYHFSLTRELYVFNNSWHWMAIILCWCAVKQLLTHSLTDWLTSCVCDLICVAGTGIAARRRRSWPHTGWSGWTDRWCCLGCWSGWIRPAAVCATTPGGRTGCSGRRGSCIPSTRRRRRWRRRTASRRSSRNIALRTEFQTDSLYNGQAKKSWILAGKTEIMHIDTLYSKFISPQQWQQYTAN